jgi:hypothetical protein
MSNGSSEYKQSGTGESALGHERSFRLPARMSASSAEQPLVHNAAKVGSLSTSAKTLAQVSFREWARSRDCCPIGTRPLRPQSSRSPSHWAALAHTICSTPPNVMNAIAKGYVRYAISVLLHPTDRSSGHRHWAYTTLPILAAEILAATESGKSASVESAKQYLQAGPYGPSEVPLSYFNAAGRYIRTGVTVTFNTYPSVAPLWR